MAMKGIFFMLVAFFVLIATLTIVRGVQAQSIASCDQCGACQGATKLPGNYTQCMQCLYPNAPQITYPMYDPTTMDAATVLARFPANSSLRTTALISRRYTAVGCIETTAGGFTNAFLGLLNALITGLGFLGLIYGGVQVMLARGDKGKLQEGRNYVYAAIATVVVVNLAVYIVKIVGKNILQIPYFG